MFLSFCYINFTEIKKNNIKNLITVNFNIQFYKNTINLIFLKFYKINTQLGVYSSKECLFQGHFHLAI